MGDSDRRRSESERRNHVNLTEGGIRVLINMTEIEERNGLDIMIKAERDINLMVEIDILREVEMDGIRDTEIDIQIGHEKSIREGEMEVVAGQIIDDLRVLYCLMMFYSRYIFLSALF